MPRWSGCSLSVLLDSQGKTLLKNWWEFGSEHCSCAWRSTYLKPIDLGFKLAGEAADAPCPECTKSQGGDVRVTHVSCTSMALLWYFPFHFLSALAFHSSSPLLQTFPFPVCFLHLGDGNSPCLVNETVLLLSPPFSLSLYCSISDAVFYVVWFTTPCNSCEQGATPMHFADIHPLNQPLLCPDTHTMTPIYISNTALYVLYMMYRLYVLYTCTYFLMYLYTHTSYSYTNNHTNTI